MANQPNAEQNQPQRNVRISMPARVAAGSHVSVKTLISHPRHSGFRHDSQGQPIARNILNSFECRYNNRLVLQDQLKPGIAANPFLAFSFLADVSGELRFVWTDDQGATTEARRVITIAET